MIIPSWMLLHLLLCIYNMLKASTVDSGAVDFAALFPLAVRSRQWSNAKIFAPWTPGCKAGCRIPSTARILEAVTHRLDEKCKGASQEPAGCGLQSLHLTPGELCKWWDGLALGGSRPLSCLGQRHSPNCVLSADLPSVLMERTCYQDKETIFTACPSPHAVWEWARGGESERWWHFSSSVSFVLSSKERSLSFIQKRGSISIFI